MRTNWSDQNNNFMQPIIYDEISNLCGSFHIVRFEITSLVLGKNCIRILTIAKF